MSAATRDVLEAENGILNVNQKLLITMNQKLVEPVAAMSRHPNESVAWSRRLDDILQSIDWKSYEAKVEQLKQEAEKQLGASARSAPNYLSSP